MPTLSRCRIAIALFVTFMLCLSSSSVQSADIAVEELASGLSHPWALAFLPGTDRMLITERSGKLRIWSPESGLSSTLRGVPQVYAHGQGGLLDVAVSPDFSQDRFVYLSYAEAGEGKSGTIVGCGKLSDDERALDDFTVIFRQTPKLSTGHHYGSRLVFDRDGYLFISLGENNQRLSSQDLDKLQGKVVRLNQDGTARAKETSASPLNFDGMCVCLWLFTQGLYRLSLLA